MTIFDNYEVWFVIGSQHLYGPEALRQVTKHAEHVVNSLNAETPCHKSIPFPPTQVHPASFASRRSFVSSGLYTASHTTSPGRKAERSFTTL